VHRAHITAIAIIFPRWCYAAVCCAVLCCAVLCCAVLCCAVLCCAVLCCTVLYCAVLCCTVLDWAVLCLLCRGVMCYGMLCWAGCAVVLKWWQRRVPTLRVYVSAVHVPVCMCVFAAVPAPDQTGSDLHRHRLLPFASPLALTATLGLNE